MFKSIFRSRKKSKSGLASASVKDTHNQSTLSRGTVLPVTAFQLNNETGHSERAVDVPDGKQMNFNVPASSSVDSIPSCTVMLSENKSYLSEAYLNIHVEPVHKEKDKENMNTIQRRNTLSRSLQKLSLGKFDGAPCVWNMQQQQFQTESKLLVQRSQVNVLTKINKMPDVLLINDFDHNETASNTKFTIQCSTVRSECGNDDFTTSESTNFHVDMLSNSKNPSRSSSSSTAALSSTDVAGWKSGTSASCPSESPLRNQTITKMDDNDNASFISLSFADDVIPQLVPLNVTEVNANSQMHEFSDVSMEATRIDKHHDAVRVVSNSANESEMFILTDSFLDYSSASCANATMKSCTPRVLNTDIMVVDDYTPQTVTVCRQEHQNRMDAEYDQCTSSMSLSWTNKEPACIALPSDSKSLHLECQREISTVKQKQWQQKPVRDWSANDVLLWVEDVGLGNFYEAFKSELDLLRNCGLNLYIVFFYSYHSSLLCGCRIFIC